MARSFNELQAQISPERRARNEARASEMIRLMKLNDRSVFTVLTGESIATMAQRGGTGNWTAAARSVKKCKFVLATRNAYCKFHPPNREEHRFAFLIGRNAGGGNLSSKPSNESGRVIVTFDEYAEIGVPEVWQKDQQPFRYFGSAEMMHWEIDPGRLKWKQLRNT